MGLLKPSAQPWLGASRRNITRRWRNIITDGGKGNWGRNMMWVWEVEGWA